MKTYILDFCGACNQNCIFCMKKEDIEKKQRKSFAEIIGEIRQAKISGSEAIDFFGGEPTVYPFLKKAIAYANKLGLKATLATNAIKFSSQKYADDFFDGIELFGLRTSLHSHEPQIHDKITRVSGSWKNTILGIRNILKHNRRLSTNIVITSLNYRDLAEIAEFVHSIGVRGIKFSGIYMKGSILDNMNIYIDYKYYKPYLLEALGKVKRLGFELVEIEKMPKEIIEISNFPEIKYVGAV